MDVWPNRLPAQFTSFVGRQREREEALGALASTRLLALTGAGGAGKTQLALEVAGASAEAFPDGGLAPLHRPKRMEVSTPSTTFVPHRATSGAPEDPTSCSLIVGEWDGGSDGFAVAIPLR